MGKLVNGDDWHTSYNYLTEEIFNAWNYATFVEQVTKAGKAELALPMYVNAWMKAPAQTQPGIYPSGGPEAHLIARIDYHPALVIYIWVIGIYIGLFVWQQ